MKNKKGFTLVELIASFALALTIMFFLFQIVIAIKDLYVYSGLKTEMMIRQTNIQKQLGTDLYEKALTDVSICGTDCYILTYGDFGSKELKVDREKSRIQYGDYSIELVDGSEIGELTISSQTVDNVALNKDNAILTINLPIVNKVIDNRNFGIHLVYQYDNRLINFGL